MPLPPGLLPPIGTPPATPGMPPVDPGGGRPTPRVALLVVGDEGNLADGDESLLIALESRGFFVIRTDDNVTPDPAETALIVIAPSAVPNTVGTKYRDLPAPAVVMEFGVFDDMAMTAAGENMNFGATAGRQVSIAADQATHPLAGGRMGTVSVAQANAPLNWGVPGPGAVVAATLLNAPQRAVIFGYPKGTAMQGGRMAPAKRVGFFTSEMLASNMSSDGKELFKAAVEWAFTP
jgi:hypothetical protein